MKKTLLLFSLFIFSICLFAQEWEPMASLPQGAADARHHPVAFTIDGYGYVATGTVNGNESNDFMRYDPTTDTWEQLPNFPGPARGYAYGTSRGTKAYMGFGLSGLGGALRDLWEYDSETEQWSQLASCPCEARLHPAFVQLDSLIFVGLGNNSNNLRDWWEYNINTDSWTQKDDFPGFARHHPFMFGIDSIAYVGFGHGTVGNPPIYVDFYKFDPSTDEWTQLQDFPGEARVAGTQFDYEGKGYVLSGDGDDHSWMAEGEFWEYDPTIDEWTQLPSHPGSSRWAPGSFVIDNYVYFLGGLSTIQLESDLMRFNLTGEPPSSTDEIFSSSIQVFPNPTDGEIAFLEDITQFSEVRLVDGFGRLVKQVLSNNVHVADLPNGIYYLQFFKNENMHSEKVVLMK
ncbi:MAG: T9SS type A sorting domain-containing protein [Bacteroidota bacterium]